MRRDFLTGVALGVGLTLAGCYTVKARAADASAITRSPQQIGDVAEMLRETCAGQVEDGRCTGRWVEHYFFLNGWALRPDAAEAARFMLHHLLHEMEHQA